MSGASTSEIREMISYKPLLENYFYIKLMGMHTWGGNQPTGQVMQFVAQNYNLV